MGALAIYAEQKRYYSLSKFETIEEFNSHFEQTMFFHKEKFTKSEYLALNKFRKFAYSELSPDTIGVAWAKAQTVVAATHRENAFGISRSTFDRMLRKAKKLNLITILHQYNKNKYQKHSVYRFNRFEELTPEAFETDRIVSKTRTIEEPQGVKIEEPITILLELPRLKDLNTYPQAEPVSKNEPEVIDFKESKTEYQQLRERIDGLYPDKKLAYKLYGAWKGKTSGYYEKPPFDIAKRSVQILISETKRRIANELKPLRNPTGYFDGILNNKLDEYTKNQIADCYDDWENEPRLVEGDEYALAKKRLTIGSVWDIPNV